jgi:ABC-type microcin C transport system duplicated ATPase subunit YejF
MELLETNEDKDLLIQQTEKYKKQLNEEFNSISQNTEKIVTNAVIIGGTLAVTYVIARMFFKSSSKRKARKKFKTLNADAEATAGASLQRDSEPGVVSKIGSALAAQATVFLLNLAKDKLAVYLQSQFTKEAEPKNEHP